ncbi:MAG: hypothetical protein IPK93_10315 [Solirubrobacterales bacterium]|nr:hypothetical protein [Solirubrobacterales bacterium]
MREIELFEDDDAYLFETDFEVIDEGQIRCVSQAIERIGIPASWSLLAGEAVHNLRSSLDHAVYAHATRNERSQFPIADTEKDFEEWSGRMLKGVPRSLREIIERAQPYQHSGGAVWADHLRWLRELSNADKHRELAAVASAVQHEFVGVADGVELEWIDFEPSRRLGPGVTQLTSLIAVREPTISTTDVEPHFKYEVLLEGRPRNWLKATVHRVYEVLSECESGLPLPATAPYPLN